MQIHSLVFVLAVYCLCYKLQYFNKPSTGGPGQTGSELQGRLVYHELSGIDGNIQLLYEMSAPVLTGAGDSRIFGIDYDTDTKMKVWMILIPIPRPRDVQYSFPIRILIPRLCKWYKVKSDEMPQFIMWDIKNLKKKNQYRDQY